MLVRIGVVDTGVDRGRWRRNQKSPIGIGVRRQGSVYRYEPEYHDLHGHGTEVALRIQSFCRNAWIHAVRIAQQGECGAISRVQEEALAMGIEWCVDQGLHIVNVSYSIAEAAGTGCLAQACVRAYERGAIVIAAYRNGTLKPVYPAAFPTVIGVRSMPESQPGQISVLSKDNHDLLAWGGSNSLACAQVSAMVGRIHTIDSSLGLGEVFGYLTEVAIPRSYVREGSKLHNETDMAAGTDA